MAIASHSDNFRSVLARNHIAKVRASGSRWTPVVRNRVGICLALLVVPETRDSVVQQSDREVTAPAGDSHSYTNCVAIS